MGPRTRSALAVILATLVLAGAAAAPVNSGAASAPTPAQGNAYAAYVLARALLPPGAQVTSTVVTSFLTIEPEPFLFPIGDQYSAHAFYDDALAPSAVSAYLESHLPSGSWVSGQGPPPPGVTQIHVQLPVSGPHAQDAQDTYTIVADETGSELRVDAQVVWNPSRARSEVAPSSGTVEVTGYALGTAMRGSFGPLTVRVRGQQAQRIRRAFDGLARSSGPAECSEFIASFEIAFVPEHKSRPTLIATATGCGVPGVVSVSTPHGSLDPLLADCALTRSVIAVLPASRVALTREVAQRCFIY